MQNGTFVSAVIGARFRNSLYCRARPFHPERLAALLESDVSGFGEPTVGGKAKADDKLGALGLVRSKGVFWLATCSESIGKWQHAGKRHDDPSIRSSCCRCMSWM